MPRLLQGQIYFAHRVKSRVPKRVKTPWLFQALTEYLKHLPYYLGVKQRWFVNLNAQGLPITEFKDNQSKTKSSRARALVFDYEQLCASTDIDLESISISDIPADDDEEETQIKQEELPF